MPVPSESVPDHVPCVNCGFDLHGQLQNQSCSECNCLIARSLDRDRLIFQPASRIRGMRASLAILLVSVILILIPASPFFLPMGGKIASLMAIGCPVVSLLFLLSNLCFSLLCLKCKFKISKALLALVVATGSIVQILGSIQWIRGAILNTTADLWFEWLPESINTVLSILSLASIPASVLLLAVLLWSVPARRTSRSVFLPLFLLAALFTLIGVNSPWVHDQEPLLVRRTVEFLAFSTWLSTMAVLISSVKILGRLENRIRQPVK